MSEQMKNKKKKEQVTIRSSAAEYLNYVACVVMISSRYRYAMKTKIYGSHRSSWLCSMAWKYTLSTIILRKYFLTANCRKRQLFEIFEKLPMTAYTYLILPDSNIAKPYCRR